MPSFCDTVTMISDKLCSFYKEHEDKIERARQKVTSNLSFEKHSTRSNYKKVVIIVGNKKITCTYTNVNK